MVLVGAPMLGEPLPWHQRALSKADLVTVTEAALEGMLRYEPVQGLSCPVLLVQGEREMALVAGPMQSWAARAERVSLQVVPAAGHLANQEEPEAFNERLLAFVRRCFAEATGG